ncbi:hypothetical protein MTO96_033482 [Rhipicephalus appendiculatus]
MVRELRSNRHQTSLITKSCKVSRPTNAVLAHCQCQISVQENSHGGAKWGHIFLSKTRSSYGVTVGYPQVHHDYRLSKRVLEGQRRLRRRSGEILPARHTFRSLVSSSNGAVETCRKYSSTQGLKLHSRIRNRGSNCRGEAELLQEARSRARQHSKVTELGK